MQYIYFTVDIYCSNFILQHPDHEAFLNFLVNLLQGLPVFIVRRFIFLKWKPIFNLNPNQISLRLSLSECLSSPVTAICFPKTLAVVVISVQTSLFSLSISLFKLFVKVMLHLCVVILIFHFWTLSWFALLEISCPEHNVLPQDHTAAEQSGRFI